jgi:PAS domain S-box-containing protein
VSQFTENTENDLHHMNRAMEEFNATNLLKTEALQKAIFNSANFSSIATDEKGVIQIFNVGAERMLGYTAIEVVGTVTPADISDPQEVIARANTLSQELETKITPGFEALVFKASRGIEDIYELTYIRKDGSRFPAVVSVTALRDAQNGLIGYLLIGTDNTARKQAEEALLKAGALQKAIFNSANFSSIATDETGVIQIFNVGAERMLGYTAIEVVGTVTPADISDPQEVIARANTLSQELETKITPGFEALIFKASRGIEDIYELTYIRKDGSRFPAVVSVTALRDAQNGIIGYLLIGTDNTARKHVEAEQKVLDQRLRDQQFYTRSLIESNIDALMTTDPAGIITDINKQMEALTGRTRDELIGAPFKDYFTDPERADAGIKRVLTERKLNDYELTARDWDGKETVVSYNATTFYNRERKLLGVFAAARDITARKQSEDRLVTERKRAKDELERLNKTLEERVAVRTTELVNANNELAAFAYSVAHELRAPIRHVDGFAIALQEIYDEPLDNKGRQFVDKIAVTSKRMGELIDDLLAFTGLRSKEVSQEHINLNELILEARSCVEPDTSKGLVVWQIRELPDVYGDRSMLHQVFINLLSNALKYSRNRPEAHIEIGCLENSADQTVLFVRDNGVGFEMEYAGKLFNAFQRLHHPSQYTGTGIGLAIVRRVIERHGGRVWAEGLAEKGATFYMSLPKLSGVINHG